MIFFTRPIKSYRDDWRFISSGQISQTRIRIGFMAEKIDEYPVIDLMGGAKIKRKKNNTFFFAKPYRPAL